MLDILPFTKYTSEPLPPRVRSLLEGAYQAAWHTLEPVLKRIVVDYEQALFKSADKARSTQEQSDYFAAMRELRKRAVDLEVAMREVLQRGMVSMVTADGAREAAKEDSSGKPQLGLVETSELEENLALGEFSAKAEMRYASGLHYLSFRFAAIAGSPPIDHELLPLGPNAMADGLKAAGHCMEISVEQRVRFYHYAEAALLGSYGELLEAVNGFLAEHGVLPHFHQMVQRSRGEPQGDKGKNKAAEPAREAPEPESEEPVEQSSSTAATDPMHAYSGAAQAGQMVPPAGAQPPPVAPSSPAAAGQAPAISGLRAEDRQRPAFTALDALWNDARQHPTAPSAPRSEPTPEDQAELFTTLRELLAGRRAQSGQAAPAADARPVAQSNDVQAVLSVLQSQPAAPVMVGGRWQARKVADVKQDLLNQLRSIGDGTPPRLSPEDNDTVDLVGMLFEQLTTGLSPVSLSHSLLTKLQVPLLKVALNDKAFFTRRKHPARMLLNEVAEAAALWVEDETADKAVLDKMQLVVDRITRDYDQDHEIFEQQLGDLGGHLQEVRRKDDIAEKRQVDAARGREKMELSRAAALEAVQARVDAAQPAAPIASFLLEAWADVLALSLLRQGPHGEDFEHDLDTADELLALTDTDLPIAERRSRFAALVGKLREGVSGVGMHDDAFKQAQTALFNALRLSPEDQPPEATARSEQEIDQALKSRPRLGADQGSEAVSTILDGLRRGERIKLTPEEKAMVDRIKQLPFGTWFEFVKNQQGERISRKLSWFSPVTGRCLFVNPRGAKADDRTIEQLARELVRGTARVLVENKETLIDRAWKAIVKAFKSTPRTDTAVAAGTGR